MFSSPPNTHDYHHHHSNDISLHHQSTQVSGSIYQPSLQHTVPPNHPSNTQWTVTNDPANVNMQSAFRNHMVIPPPENRDKMSLCKTSFVAVDSASRNHSEFPEPNDYSIPLPSEIKDVKSLQLVSYKIPRPQFPVRETNNAIHFTNTSVAVTNNGDGTYDIDDHKTTNMKSVRVPPGKYGDTIFPSSEASVSVDPAVNAFRNEIASNQGVDELQQDSLSRAIENVLNNQAASTYAVYIDSSSEQYTVATNFANPTSGPDVCTDPIFFAMFFQGCEEFYNGSIDGRVEVTPDTQTTSSLCASNQGCGTYKTCKFGKKHYQYTPNSIGPIIGHPRTDPRTLLKGTANNTDDPNTLVGTGTSFLKELSPGDWLYVVERDTGTAYRVHVHSVTDDTTATIDCDGSGGGTPPTFGDAYAWNGRITMPWSRNLQPDCYLSMYLNCAKTLKSFTTAIDGAFYLVPGDKDEFCSIPEFLPYKSFSPTLGRLEKLDIKFKNADNTLYDFKGKNHTLLFKVVHYRQNVAFGDV